jgi:hypothetical protein
MQFVGQPVVLVRKSDGKTVALHSVSLTNKPAIVGMRALVNSRGSGQVDERAARILKAGRAWDGEPLLQKVCGRSAFIEDLLRQEGFALLSHIERGQLAARSEGPGSNRAELIRALAREWGEHPELQRIVDRDTYINGTLLAGGLPKMNQIEAL